jgi:hypothetical protein
MDRVSEYLAVTGSFLATVTSISPEARFVIGGLLVVIGVALLRFLPAIHEKYFGQFRLSDLQRVGGPAFVIAMGCVLIFGGIVAVS